MSTDASRTLVRICVLAVCTLPMHGQTANTGAIAGTVSDPSGALIPHAAVVIPQPCTPQEAWLRVRPLADAGRSGSVSIRVNEFFNTSAFVPAPFVPDGGLIDRRYPVSSGGGTVFGNLGRNILRGPDQQDLDIAVIKTTPLTDRVKLIFRWETFNVLNRANSANPSNDVSTPSNFGVISALTVNPRIMQYAIKLQF